MHNGIVLDTNTIISAVLIPTSLPRHAFEAAFRHGIVLVSDATLAELTEVIQRTRFDRYVSSIERRLFLASFIRNTTSILVTETITDCSDPKDNKFLELAVSGNATYLVSGDTDLLDLNPYRSMTILTPRTFLDRIQLPEP